MRILLSAIYPYTFLLLYLIIPFDNYVRVLPNILLAILVIAFPFIVRKADLKRLKSLPIVFFLAFFAYLCINSFLADRWVDDFNIIKKVMIAVGMAILYIPVIDGDSPNGRTEKLNTAVIFSSLAAILFSVYNFVIITDVYGSIAFGDSPQVIESLLIDRIYLGLLSVLSILISFQAIQKKYHPTNNYYLANILINAVFIILIASKIAVVALFTLVLIRQFYGQRKLWKVVFVIISIAGLMGLFFVVKNGTNLEQSENFPNDPPSFIEDSMTYELRAVVWQCAANIMDNNGFMLSGIGFDQTKDELVACYDSGITDLGKREKFISERYNTHNQFLDFYLSAGFIALLLFLVFILVSFISNRKQFFPTAMLSILILYCLVENPFNRQIGSYYVGFILIVLMTGPKGMKTTI